MKSRLFFLLSCLASVALAASPSANHNKTVLNKGMSGAAIIQAYGQPDEIVPMKVAEGKAEKWIYRRKLGHTVQQTANTEAFIPAMVGFTAGGMTIGRALVPDYRLKYIADYQVTALLMVNDQLQLGRQWSQRDESFAD
jgi:hypothetical protein